MLVQMRRQGDERDMKTQRRRESKRNTEKLIDIERDTHADKH